MSMYVVCLFVCLFSGTHMSTSNLNQTFFACYLWLWLDFFWRHRDMLHTSGFVDDVVFLNDGQKQATRKTYTHFRKQSRTSRVSRYLLSPCVCLSIRLSICLSQAGITSKRLDKSNWFSAWRLPSTHPTLCCKKIYVSPKIRVLLSGNSSQTRDLENFAMAGRSLNL